MLLSNYTKDLLNLQDVNIIKVHHLESETLIYTQLPVKPHICPCCSLETTYVHDYRVRKIKYISAFGKHATLIHNHRRYVCKHCGKRFAENNPFAPKELPKVLSIDEFMGNTDKEKYQVIITNPADGTALDILQDRKQSHLISYFKQWNRDERNFVKFFVSDMWKPYSDLSVISMDFNSSKQPIKRLSALCFNLYKLGKINI